MATEKNTHRLDGIDFEAGSAAHISAVEKIKTERDAAVKRADAAEASVKAEKERADAAETKVKNLPSTIAERVSLITLARTRTPLGVKYLDKKEDMAAATDDQIILDVLKALNPAFDPAGMDPAALRGALMYAIKQIAPSADKPAETPSAVPDAVGVPAPVAHDALAGYRGDLSKGGKAPEPTFDQKIAKRRADAWKKGLEKN